ncbi:MAG: carboxypeptidase-like regulatory domain-containing protein, partial [Terracidiphilus sp.]
MTSLQGFTARAFLFQNQLRTTLRTFFAFTVGAVLPSFPAEPVPAMAERDHKQSGRQWRYRPQISRTFCFLAILFLSLASVSARAQYRTSIQGTVTDPTGAVIPGATLTLKNLATNETVVRTSDATGVF